MPLRKSLLLLLVVGMMLGIGSAGEKPDPAVDNLLKALHQTAIWQGGPVLLDAKFRVLASKSNPEINMEYIVNWQNPDKWRAEWKGGGYSRIAVANEGKLYTASSRTNPVPRLLQFEEAMQTVSGVGPMQMVAPIEKPIATKVKVTAPRIDGVTMRCVERLEYEQSLCYEPVSLRIMQAQSVTGLFDTARYTDYQSFGDRVFPRTITIYDGTNPVMEATITLSRNVEADAKLYLPPPDSVVRDFPACVEPWKDGSLAKLIKQVPPRYPDEEYKMVHTGTVWLYVTIDKDGSVGDVKVIASAGPNFDPAAETAVRAWKYTPMMRCGQPVETHTVVRIAFGQRSGRM